MSILSLKTNFGMLLSISKAPLDVAEYKQVVLGLILYTFWEDSDGLHIACSIPQKSIVYYREALQRQHF